MRVTLGPLLAHLALGVAGLGVLQLTGHLRPLSPRRLLFAGGLAYMAGAATVTTVLIVLNIAGVGLSLGVFAVVCAVVAAPAAPALLRPSTWAPLRRRPTLAAARRVGAETWAAAAIVAGLAWIFVMGARAVARAPLGEFDSWLIWTRKAVLLTYNPHIPDVFVQTKVESGGHWDYPLLFPMLQALQFRASGTILPEQSHLISWILLFAFVWAAAFLASRFTRPIVWSAVLAGVVLLEIPQVTTGLADTPMACFLGLGALAVGLWVEQGRTGDLAIGAVMLAGAAGLKTEGIMGAFIVLGAAAAVELASRDWRRARAAALALLAVALVAVVPWQAWVRSHDIPPTTSLGKALNPAYLIDHADRVWPSVHALYEVLAGLNLVQFVLPVALALIIVRWRSMPRVTSFYLAVGVAYFASLVWAYWTTPLDLDFLIGTSVARIHVGIVFLATAAVLHLAGDRVAPSTGVPERALPASDVEPVPRVAQPLA